MTESAMRKIVDHGTGIPYLNSGKKAMVNAVEDYVSAARRAVKHGRFAAEDMVDEAAHNIKQHPLQAVVLTFGLAFGVGTLFGWIVSGTHKR